MTFLPLPEPVQEAARRAGFEVAGVVDLGYLENRDERRNNVTDSKSEDTPAEETPFARDLENLHRWLARDAHAGMEYMAKNLEARSDARKILSQARSAIVLAAPYATGRRVRTGKGEGRPGKGEGRPGKVEVPTGNEEVRIGNESVRSDKVEEGAGDWDTGMRRTIPTQKTRAGKAAPDAIPPLVARYARGKDYHRELKKRADAFAKALPSLLGMEAASFTFRTVVDSVPFLDRAHAREARLGFLGKNTMIIRPGLGSYFFIASVLTSVPADTLAPATVPAHPFDTLSCGDCTLCLDACPTQALREPYFLDANRCLSYLSIEHRGPVENAYLPHFRDTIYGCDVCQQVCPYNFSTLDRVRVQAFQEPHPPLAHVTADRMARMSQREYEEWFGGTAMTRAKYAGLVRNALYHLHAAGSADLPLILRERAQEAHPDIVPIVDQLVSLSQPPGET